MKTPTKTPNHTLAGLSLMLVALTALPGCGAGTTTAVKSDDAALGRVVIYRNGVAYYERIAEVTTGQLAIAVPSDKIDDFLKSMTVTDLETGQPLPLSFPAPGASKGGVTLLLVALPMAPPTRPGGAVKARRVKLTYVTEAAAWKPSYRVMVSDGGKVELQGWAVVDNTSKEDWRHVKIGVGSSSALAFRYDLRSIRTVQRQTLRDDNRFVQAPPTGSSIGQPAGPSGEKVLAAVDDVNLARPAGHPDVADAGAEREEQAAPQRAQSETTMRAGYGRGGVVSQSGSLASKAARAPYSKRPATKSQSYRVASDKAKKDQPSDSRDQWLDALADRLRRTGQNVRVDGYGDAGEADCDNRSKDRAHMLRNQLIERGVAPAQVVAVGNGSVSGHAAGVRVVATDAPSPASGKSAKAGDAPPVGESHFESDGPMTVAAGTSAMVSIVKSPTNGDVVYLYQPDGRGGDARFAFKAVRFRNNTGSTLDPGPMTVYGAGRFIGEGMADPIPPGALAVVPFALDRQIAVERDDATRDEIASLVKLSRGVLTTEVQHLRTTKLVIANRGATTATVLLRHHTPRGWTLKSAPDHIEEIGSVRLFAVKLAAGERQSVTIEETTPLRRTIDLRSPVGVELVRLYLRTPAADAGLREAMTRILAHFDDMVRNDEQIAHLRERASELRVRLDELHGQLASLEGMRRGATLESHLQRKMKETSEAVQQATLSILDAQEARMLSRVRFQDELSELTLTDAVAKPATKPAAGHKPVAKADKVS